MPACDWIGFSVPQPYYELKHKLTLTLTSTLRRVRENKEQPLLRGLFDSGNSLTCWQKHVTQIQSCIQSLPSRPTANTLAHASHYLRPHIYPSQSRRSSRSRPSALRRLSGETLPTEVADLANSETMTASPTMKRGNSEPSNRRGAAKRRNLARADKDGDLVMDGGITARTRVGKGRGRGTTARDTAKVAGRNILNTAAVQREILRHVASGDAVPRGPRTSTSANKRTA